jgi:predicted MFS family arabinose efflux permease
MAGALSSFGDQFFAVALPWLVLELSRSDAALGTVLMTAALPSAALTLVGGALSDRVPPARVLFFATLTRALLVATVAALVIAGLAQLWHLYVLALVFGVLSALSGPASTAIVPRVADDKGLPAANGILQSTSQVSAFVAPTPAGVLMASAGTGASFAVSAVASGLAGLVFVLLPGARSSASASGDAPLPTSPASTPGSTMETLRAYLGHPALQAYLMLIATLSLATSGPLAVGIPSLARVRFGGSVSLGLMLSASGAGAFIGTLLAGSRGRMRHRGALLLGVNALIGVLLILLAYAPTVASASLVIGAMACGSSFVNLIVIAKLQEADPAILGRLMGVVMLASVGLTPVSYLLAGLASAVDPALMFGAAGALVIAATGRAAFAPALRRVD